MPPHILRNVIRLALLTAAILIPWAAPAPAKDIKDQVISETILDEQINVFCKLNCVGNKSEGTLRTLTLEPNGKDKYAVFGIAALRNRHVMSAYTIYDHTVYVSSHGTLNSTTCKLTVDDAKVDNDYKGMFTSLLKSQGDVVGKVFIVPDCRRFTE